MRYRDTELSCLTTYEAEDKHDRALQLPSMFPSCPAEPMPMKETELRTFKELSPYLYAYPRDPADKDLPYRGFLMRGTPGDPSQTFAMVGEAPAGVKKQNTCVNQISFDTGSVEDQAKLVRLQLDNCANQFVLQAAIYPYQKDYSQLTCQTESLPGQPSRRCEQADLCQPLEMKETPKQEYMASDYLLAAWKKLLQDPSYRKTPGAEKEPHLPEGITLEKPIAPPTIQQIRLNSLAATPYEEIIDPSHPFSPRWDFKYNERAHYSPKVADYQSRYHDNEKAVYCAGNRADSGNAQQDKDYKVDVLEFRREPFDKGINGRIDFNKACYNDRQTYSVPIASPAFAQMVAKSYCYRVDWPPTPTDPGQATRLPCWQCFGLNPGQKVDDASTTPPCTTRYDGSDRSIEKKSSINGPFPGGLNNTKRTARCTSNVGETKKPITQLCADLRAPYVPLNKLKMRYHNPEGNQSTHGGPDTVVLKDGVQEGMWHTEYFDGHMPYPRLWDTGSSIQRYAVAEQQDPLDDLGQYTAIVGVGREAAPVSVNNSLPAKEQKRDERCLLGGWGENVSFGPARIEIPDPVTSWTELKLYQANTTRETRVVCLGRYEKAFKHRSNENILLMAGGATTSLIVRTECDLDDNGRTVPGTCESKTVAELKETGTQSGTTDGKRWSSIQYVRDNYPLAWRGYMSADDDATRFPNLGGNAPVIRGLDNAQCGDFILMPQGGAEADSDRPGLPKIARVYCEKGKKTEKSVSAVRCADKSCFITVEETDNGKWPDVCGTTQMIGEMKRRQIYKPGSLRDGAADEAKRIGWTASCEDTGLSECEMEPWDELELYRPVEHVITRSPQ